MLYSLDLKKTGDGVPSSLERAKRADSNMSEIAGRCIAAMLAVLALALIATGSLALDGKIFLGSSVALKVSVVSAIACGVFSLLVVSSWSFRKPIGKVLHENASS